MRKGLGTRFLIVGLLILLMFIPLFFVAEVVGDRRSLSRETIRQIGAQWGGEQTISGPRLSIPVRAEVDRVTQRDMVDPSTGRAVIDPDTGQPRQQSITERVSVTRAPLILYPTDYLIEIDSETELRHRGIFTAPVYRARLLARFGFDTDGAAPLLGNDEELLWDRARIEVFLSSNAALRGEARLTRAGEDIALEPNPDARTPGIVAQVGDPRGQEGFELQLGLNGAAQLFVTPVGRDTTVRMRSDWPDPSFQGAFLPDRSEIGEDGFSAEWTIPHLARTLPQMTRDDFHDETRRFMSFGVEYFEPNNFYQKAFRAARYGILYIALTFLTVLLIDRGRDKPVHPVQYLLIGLVQATFVLLMVSYAEQIGFGPAYLLAAGAVTLLLTLFGWAGLGLGRRSLVLGALLVLVYAVLYLILRSTDYALLAGSTLAFLALAATMFATRNEEWYGPEGGGWFQRDKAKPDADPPEKDG